MSGVMIMRTLVFAATITLISAVWPTQSASSPLIKYLLELPPPEARTVLGMWKSVEPLADMTRTIELVGKRYYMVARITDEHGVRSGGTNGLELRRVSATEYWGVSPNRSVYRITPAGELVMFAVGESAPSMRAVPHPRVWPR